MHRHTAHCITIISHMHHLRCSDLGPSSSDFCEGLSWGVQPDSDSESVLVAMAHGGINGDPNPVKLNCALLAVYSRLGARLKC